MGSLVDQRGIFVAAVNLAFSAARVAETLRRLGPQTPAMDALEIVARLDLLTWVPPGSFFEYRDKVGIPPLHMRVLTLAFHAALLDPTGPRPLVLDIVEGRVEGVEVSQPGGHIAVKLTRTSLDPLLSAS